MAAEGYDLAMGDYHTLVAIGAALKPSIGMPALFLTMLMGF